MKKGATIKKDEVSEKQPIVSMGNKQKKEECIRQCISITNTEKYKTLYALVSKCSNGHQYIESS
jgi:deoxyinosine 3'endonuclease (endonuclease V)